MNIKRFSDHPVCIILHTTKPTLACTCPQNNLRAEPYLCAAEVDFFFRVKIYYVRLCIIIIFTNQVTKYHVTLLLLRTLPFGPVDFQGELIVTGKIDCGHGFWFAAFSTVRRPVVSDHHRELIADHRFFHIFCRF